MISCDPTSLSQSAQGFKRIPKQMLSAVRTFLLCQFANKGSGPPPPVPPAVPTGIDIDDASSEGNTIVLWTNSDVPTTNEVWKSTDGINFALFSTVGGGVHTITDNTVMNDGDFFYYKVRACNGATCSAFSSVVSVAKNILLGGGAYAGVTLNLPTLILVYGQFDYDAAPNLTSVSVPLLRHATGDFNFNGCPHLASITATKLITVSNNLLVENCAVITALSFPNLVSVSSAFACDTCPLLASLSLPLLATVTDFVCSDCAVLPTVSMPSLTTATGSIVGDMCPSLETFSAAALTTVGGQFSLNQAGSLTALDVGSLVSIGGDFILAQAGFATPLSPPSLTSIGGSFDLTSCFNLPSILVPSLTTIGAAFGFQTCPNLDTVNLPSLTSLGADLVANGSSSLFTFSIPVLIFADGYGVNFNGCALVVGNSGAGTGVDGILRRLVLSGVTTDNVDLSGGANAAPDAPGLADKATLIGWGNTVATN